MLRPTAVHTYTRAQLHTQQVLNLPRHSRVLRAAPPCPCKPTEARLHTRTHLSRFRPDVQNRTPMLRITHIFQTRKEHVCSGLSTYTHVLRPIKAPACVCVLRRRIPQPCSAQSHTRAQIHLHHTHSHVCSGHRFLHMCSDLQTLMDVSESQVCLCMFRTGTYTVCADYTHALTS